MKAIHGLGLGIGLVLLASTTVAQAPDGKALYEKNCKITCPNCGNQFDCSDLNIYFD